MSDSFSYIDTALRVIYINKSSSGNPEQQQQLNNFIATADTSSHIKIEMLSKHLHYEIATNKDIQKALLHEFHHYLQSLCYPFLYYLNWLEFENLMELRLQVKSSEEPSFPIGDISMHNRYAANYRYTSQRFQLYWKNDQLMMKDAEFSSPENQVFSLNDMLEDVTSIFQYKLTVENPNYEDYYDWIRDPKNRCYKRLYLFMVKQVGKKQTYDLLPILVQAAFSTSEPIGAFCNSATYFNYHLPHYENFSTNEIYEKLISWLTEKLGMMDVDLTTIDNFVDTPVKVLDHHCIQKVVQYGLESFDMFHYPLGLHAQKFYKEITRNPAIKYYLIDIDREKFAYLDNEFSPMAIHYYFHQMKGRDSLMMVGRDFLDGKTPENIPYRFYIRELMKLKEVTQAMFTRVQQHIPFNCHHTDCQYYQLEICKKWNSIPMDHKGCGFPAWFTFTFHRKINLETMTFDKVPVEIARSNWEAYEKLAFKHRSYNYIKSPGGYTLTIHKDDWDHEEKEFMFRDFINHLIIEKGIAPEDLTSAISLDFYGFDSDRRPLFQIKEARDWMHRTMEQVPEFLCYINFLSPENHKFILLPAFVKHRIISPDLDNYQIQFDAVSQRKFLFEQLQTALGYMQQNPKVDQQLLFNNFNTFINGN